MTSKFYNNILIVRLSAIGDIVMASPVAERIKARYPDARLSWLVQAECASLLRDNPYIDEVIVWPRQEWQQLWREKRLYKLFCMVRRYRREMHAHQFDTGIDLQGLAKSGVLLALSGAKYRIGLGSREGSQWFMHHVIPRDQGDSDAISSEYRWLCRELELDEKQFALSLPTNQQSADTAKSLLQNETAGPIAVICPFTTRPQKHWIDSHWHALIPALENLSYQVVMLGGPADDEHAKRLAAEHPNLRNWVGKTTLQEAASVIKNAHCLIGVDTGLTHMGHAAGIPTIALFGSTRPYLHVPTQNALEHNEREIVPLNTTSRVIYHHLECSPCKRNPSCDGRYDCMQAITAKEVITHLKQITAKKDKLQEISE